MKTLRSLAPSVALFTLVALLSSCATTADGRKTQGQGTALGAVLGGLAGAAIGAATGNRDNILRGAAIGAAAGGAAGFAYGTNVAKRKAEFARTEDWLDVSIAQAKRANRSAYAYNDKLEQRVAALQQRARAARAANNKAAIRKIHNEVVTLQKQANSQAAALDEEIGAQNAVASDRDAKGAGNYADLRQEMKELNGAKSGLNRSRQRLASLGNEVDI